MLLNGALTAETEVDRETISTLKKVGLNMNVLLSEALHTLQDNVIVELRV